MRKRRKKKSYILFNSIILMIVLSIGLFVFKDPINNFLNYFKELYKNNASIILLSVFILTFSFIGLFIYLKLPFTLKHRLKCLLFGYAQNPHEIVQKLDFYIGQLENLKKNTNRVVDLEFLCAKSLELLTPDGLVQPNYKLDNKNNPISHAPKNVPDCEFFGSFNMILEVTNMENKNQWLSEGQPIMRHLRDFEIKNKKDAYCLFIAPSIHRDALNTYYMANKYEYEGKKTKIIPLTIKQWVIILMYVGHQYKVHHGFKFNTDGLKKLLDYFYVQIENTSNSIQWMEKINKEINRLVI